MKLAEIEKASVTKRPACAVRSIIARLDPDDRAALKRMLASDDWSLRAIVTALRQAGEAISRDSVARHRNAECSCLDGPK